MIIVSQNKDKIVNFDNITFLDIDKSNGMYIVKCNVINENRIYLGEYVTEERAKEILQEIIKQYKELITSYQKGRSDYPIETLIFNRNVYEMPEE